MKKIEITSSILKIHEEKIMHALVKEVAEELRDGVSENLQIELNDLLARANPEHAHSKDNVLSFHHKSSYQQSVTRRFDSVELLAAAGLVTETWFSTSISFGEEGFSLDIRRVIDTECEVDLYFSSTLSSPDTMAKSLSDYKNKDISILISNNGVQLLEATIYVDGSGTAAEGSGRLLNLDMYHNVKGKLSLDVIT
jgi:hypothetical protein